MLTFSEEFRGTGISVPLSFAPFFRFPGSLARVRLVPWPAGFRVLSPAPILQPVPTPRDSPCLPRRSPTCPGVVPARRNEAGRRSLPASGGPGRAACRLPPATAKFAQANEDGSILHSLARVRLVPWPAAFCTFFPPIPPPFSAISLAAVKPRRACPARGLRPPWPGCGSGRQPRHGSWPCQGGPLPWPAALKAVQFPCQRRGKKVITIKVCTWHG